MQVAGFSTGVFMAASESDGKRALLIRPLLRAAPLDPSFRAAPVGYLRSAPVGYSAGRLRASHRRSDRVASPRLRASLRFLTSAPMGYYTDRIRPVSHGPACTPEDASNVPTDNKPEDAATKGWTSFVDQIVSFLRGDVFRLMILGVSIFIGYAASVKSNKLAGDTVDVCDKAHKIYNIFSKALPVILAFFKR